MVMRIIAITARSDNDVFYLGLLRRHHPVLYKRTMGKRKKTLGGESIFLVNSHGEGNTSILYSC